MTAVVLVALPDSNEDGTKRPLSAVRHDNSPRLGQVGRQAADQRKLETPRSCGRLHKRPLAFPYMVWHGSERLPVARQFLAIFGLRSQANPDKGVSHFSCQNSR